MEKNNTEKTGSRDFDLWVIPKLIIFVFLSAAASTPLRIFVEAVIYKKDGAPEFVTAGFLIYSFFAKLVVGFGYMVFGCRLPVKNNIKRAFCYIMLILVSSYLPNILAMAGGDGEIIEASLSAGIVVVDVISYVLEGLILGLLMKKYAVEKPEHISKINARRFFAACVVNGVAFPSLNYIADILAGLVDDSWRLCSILKVSSESEISFYIVFSVFMFVAGFLLPLWNKYCLDEDASLWDAILYALKLSGIVWLPNVLIMAFFGTPVFLTLLYGAAYVLMFVICILIYRFISRAR